MLVIDGSYGEGGGQIVRSALALSVITGKPFKIINIRARRPKPGLKAQHLTGVKALLQICKGAKAYGASLGSTELEFYPGIPKGGYYKIDIGTAGSISLLLQTLIPVILHADGPVTLEITGGTDVRWSPPIDYYRFVYAEILRRHGADIEIEVVKRGYYPRGGGKVIVKARPIEKLRRIELLEVSDAKAVRGISHASARLKSRRVSERIAESCRKILEGKGFDTNISVEYCDTLSDGAGITVWLDYGKAIIGADALGERGKSSEQVGREAAENLLKEYGYPVDRYLADHLVLWIGLYGGAFRTSEITKHTETNIWVCSQFLEREYKIKEKEVRC